MKDDGVRLARLAKVSRGPEIVGSLRVQQASKNSLGAPEQVIVSMWFIRVA